MSLKITEQNNMLDVFNESTLLQRTGEYLTGESTTTVIPLYVNIIVIISWCMYTSTISYVTDASIIFVGNCGCNALIHRHIS